jgi:hypothetical protein
VLKLTHIATGTGRCGTLFAANFLTSSGFPCSHEGVFNLGGLGTARDVVFGNGKAISSKVSRGDNLSDYEMEIVADSSYMSAPFLGFFPRSQIIHIVRNPIFVVKSFLGFEYFSKPFPVEQKYDRDHIKYEDFMYSHLPELAEEMPQLDRACLYWAAWNEMIEATGRVGYRHRIEDSTEHLSEFLGSKGTYSNNKCNSFDVGRRWTLSQIQTPRIKNRLKDVAKRYGYLSILFD